MKALNRLLTVLILLISVNLAAGAQGNGGIQLLPEEKVSKLLPATVFLDGENPPTQARNTFLAQMPNGKLLLFTMIDTTGYSAAYQEKYIGAFLAQSAFKLGSATLQPGAYGFGRKKSSADSVTFFLYDIGGNKVAEVPTQKQEDLRPLKVVQLTVEKDGSARFYLGPYYASISAAP
ncbi:MAG TPA: hypothetical protein VEG30_00170 [Terriglobales bacterium]|nr:hypothetical protein [Terriglobales bacterium]